jgi:hypothetical protein
VSIEVDDAGESEVFQCKWLSLFWTGCTVDQRAQESCNLADEWYRGLQFHSFEISVAIVLTPCTRQRNRFLEVVQSPAKTIEAK